jgi:serine/threonine-protein kinase HipA
MKKGKVFYRNVFAGFLTEDENGYSFLYQQEYLSSDKPKAISFTLPLQEKPFKSKTMFPFFDGLIPEGWLLDIAENNWKINSRDRMSLLLAFCKDCIGAVSVVPFEVAVEEDDVQ